MRGYEIVVPSLPKTIYHIIENGLFVSRSLRSAANELPNQSGGHWSEKYLTDLTRRSNGTESDCPSLSLVGTPYFRVSSAIVRRVLGGIQKD